MRKMLFTLLLTSAFISSRAQHIAKPHPVIMVDSVQMDYNTLALMDPQEINSMNIPHDPKYPDGIIYITLKDHSTLQTLLMSKRLSLQNLADKYIAKADKGKPIIYMLNGTLITDTANVRVLAERYYNVQVTKASEMPYFKKAFPNMLLLKVSTHRSITIRGDNNLPLVDAQ
ncbi:MAG: hypothetical protein ABI367_02810 [Mucilaginibacter sp.]